MGPSGPMHSPEGTLAIIPIVLKNTVSTANKHKTKLPPVQDNQAPATLPFVQIQKKIIKIKQTN